MKKLSSAALALLSTSALMTASSAFAQDSGDTSFGEDVIISTATRRPEALQDVPIAVTVIAPEVLEKQGVVNIQNLSIVAPSFASSQAQTASGTVVLRIRGVGTTSNNIGFESALDSAGGFVNATYGNYAHKSVQGAVNIPLVEGKVAARLTGAYRERNGYIRLFDRNGTRIGESNGIDQVMLRGQIGWEGDNGFKGRAILDYQSSDAPVGAALEVQQSPVETAGLFAAVGLGARGGMVGTDVAIGPNDDDGASMDQTGLTLEVEYPVSESADLIYIGSLRGYDATENYDSDFSGLDVLNVLESPLEIGLWRAGGCPAFRANGWSVRRKPADCFLRRRSCWNHARAELCARQQELLALHPQHI